MLLQFVHPTIIKQWQVHRVPAFTVWDDEKGKGYVLGHDWCYRGCGPCVVPWDIIQLSNIPSITTYVESHIACYIVLDHEQWA